MEPTRTTCFSSKCETPLDAATIERLQNTISLQPTDTIHPQKYSSDQFKDAATKKATRNLQYALWAHELADLAGASCIVCGLLTVAWFLYSSVSHVWIDGIWLGHYSFCLGVAICIFDGLTFTAVPLWNPSSRMGHIPFRGIIYIILSWPLWLSFSTGIAAFCLFSSGIVYAYAVIRGEAGYIDDLIQYHAKKSQTRTKSKRTRSCGSCKNILRRIRKVFEGGKAMKSLIIVVYVTSNIVFGAYSLYTWTNKLYSARNSSIDCTTLWDASGTKLSAADEQVCIMASLNYGAVIAKACGTLINLNFAALWLPMCRWLVRWLNNVRIPGRGGLNLLGTHIPLRKNIAFHRSIAKFVGVLTIGHILGHGINYAYAPQATIAAFPNKFQSPWYGYVKYAPFITGALATVFMILIYTSAHKIVRRANFELFWWVHHLYIPTAICLIFHGPNMLFWTIGPIIMYTYERIRRNQESKRKIYLHSIYFIPPVLEVRLVPSDPESFEFFEGQYIYLNCPCISEHEWHPFTISSSNDDLRLHDFFSVHIKIQRHGWTEKLNNLLQKMNPHKLPTLVLFRRNKRGELLTGKWLGPDGKPFIRTDGPHAAPSQAYVSFESAMIVTSGIGITPMSAIMQACLKYRWTKGWPPNRLHCFWVIRHEQLQSFQWFFQRLAVLEAELSHAREVGALSRETHFFQLHIFVTRVKRSNTLKFEQLDTQEDPLTQQKWQTANQMLQQYERVLRAPDTMSSSFVRVMKYASQAQNRIADTFIWHGRPNWDRVFDLVKWNELNTLSYRELRRRHAPICVGVCVCGVYEFASEVGRTAVQHSVMKRYRRKPGFKSKFSALKEFLPRPGSPSRPKVDMSWRRFTPESHTADSSYIQLHRASTISNLGEDTHNHLGRRPHRRSLTSDDVTQISGEPSETPVVSIAVETDQLIENPLSAPTENDANRPRRLSDVNVEITDEFLARPPDVLFRVFKETF